jgi:hypothetical protein
MSDNDFSSPPPGRAVVRAEYAGLDPAEARLRDAQRLAGVAVQWTPPAPRWQAGAPSAPEVLRLLDFPHASTGMPSPVGRFIEPPPPSPAATDEEIAEHLGRRHRLFEAHREADDTYMERFRFWVGLDAASKTQLAADTQDRNSTDPSWLCTMPQDNAQVPVVLKAKDEHEARSKYEKLCGILFAPRLPETGHAEPIQVTPYTPPPAPAPA